MHEERRILNFIKHASVALFYLTTIFTIFSTPRPFALGVILGGLLVTTNFHLMCRSVKGALTPPHNVNTSSAIVKHFLRFAASIAIISTLIIKGWVHPVGLIIGLSVIVASFFLAAINEVRIICHEKRKN